VLTVSTSYDAAYVFLEKLRKRQHKPKSKRRLTAEVEVAAQDAVRLAQQQAAQARFDSFKAAYNLLMTHYDLHISPAFIYCPQLFVHCTPAHYAHQGYDALQLTELEKLVVSLNLGVVQCPHPGPPRFHGGWIHLARGSHMQRLEAESRYSDQLDAHLNLQRLHTDLALVQQKVALRRTGHTDNRVIPSSPAPDIVRFDMCTGEQQYEARQPFIPVQIAPGQYMFLNLM